MDYLLWCGADPLLRTAAGELALELVPKCTFKPSRGLFGWRPSSTCDCGSDEEGGDPGDCGKHAVRALLARSCLVTFHAGLVSWVKLALLCLLAMLGLWGCHGSLDRCWLRGACFCMYVSNLMVSGAQNASGSCALCPTCSFLPRVSLLTCGCAKEER